MSARTKLIVTAFAVGLSAAASFGLPATVDAIERKPSCSAFGVSASTTTSWFKASSSFAQSWNNAQSIPIYIPKLCCYRWLGCFLC